MLLDMCDVAGTGGMNYDDWHTCKVHRRAQNEPCFVIDITPPCILPRKMVNQRFDHVGSAPCVLPQK